jgi:glycosyltransferase involved in cell wall biosynthesis
VEHVVRFLGFVPFDTLRCFYETAAAFVFPSRYEGFGLPPLEAMACGTPVIAADAPAMSEVLGNAATLVPRRDPGAIARAVAALLESESARAEWAAKGQERAAVFSWSRAATETVDVYREALRQ